MELIEKALSKKQVSLLVENDEIPFRIKLNKDIVPSCEDEYEDFYKHLSELVIGDTNGEVIYWNVTKEVIPDIVEIQGIINVAKFLFGDSSASDLIEYWEEECAAHLGYSNDKKDMYEGKW